MHAIEIVSLDEWDFKMSSGTASESQRWLELLAGYAIGDLTPEEEMELKRLERQGESSGRHEFERVAAAIAIALSSAEHVPMPNDLRVKVQEAMVAQVAELQLGPTSGAAAALSKELEIVHCERRSSFNGLYLRERIAWLGLAASLMIAVGLWLSRTQSTTTLVALSQRRLALIEQAKDLIQVAWTEGKTPFESPVKGDVTWSTVRQEGYMRFSGMPRNDPTIQQYQLWIIDPARDDEPIDGGVFDIQSSDEHIVPIAAKLAVLTPKAFAITIEKPGGVVVSSQERLPLLAAIP